MTSTCLGFDYGTQQIGIAYGQPVTATATPVTTLRAKDGKPNWQEIEALIKEWQPRVLIVGLPLNMDDSESEFCQRARKFARRLHGRYGLPVMMMDERLSTFEAKQQWQQRHDGRQPSNFKQNPVDADAAAILLNSWLQHPELATSP